MRLETSNPYEGVAAGREKIYAFFPFLIGGLVESVNPCMTVASFFLLFYLMTSDLDRWQRLLFGCLFIFSAFGTNFLIGWGGFAYFRTLELYYVITRSLYLFLALLLLSFGVILIHDVLRLKKAPDSNRVIVRFPFLTGQSADRKSLDFGRKVHGRWVKIILGALIFGFVSVFFQAGFLAKIALPLANKMLKTPETIVQTFLWIAVFNFTFVLPQALLFFGMHSVMSSQKWIDRINRNLSKLRVSLSGMSFGFGLGLLYLWK